MIVRLSTLGADYDYIGGSLCCIFFTVLYSYHRRQVRNAIVRNSTIQSAFSNPHI